MRGGKLKHRITFQSRSTATDDYGDQVDAWADFATNVPASIEPLNGRELVAAQAIHNEIRTRVTVRYFPGLFAGMRIIFGARILNIITVRHIDERNKEIQLDCSEGLAKG